MTAPVTLDLAGIRARAEAATPGPWFVTGDPWFRSSDGVLAGSPDGNVAFVIIDCEAIGAQRDEYEGPFKLSTAEADAAYVATMDPPTTLALVAEVECLRSLANCLGDRQEIYEVENAGFRAFIEQLRQERDEARLAKSKAWDEVAELLNDLAESRAATIKATKERDDAHAGNWGFLRVTDEVVQRVGLGFSQGCGMTWTDEGIRHGLEQLVYAAPADKVHAFEKLEAERGRADTAEAERDQAQHNRDRYQGLAIKHFLRARKLQARVAELEARP